MPISITVDHKARLIRFTLSGPLDTAEMLAAVDSALDQVDGQDGYDVLSDHRALTTPATPEQVKILIEHLRTRGHPFKGRRGATVVSTETSYGMMRLFSAHAESLDLRVHVFRDLKSAEEALGVGR